eukprot:7120667-Prymnesium_polylepis.1
MIESSTRSAWRAWLVRAEQRQLCGGLSSSRRCTHGCRKQLRASSSGRTSRAPSHHLPRPASNMWRPST